MGVIGICRSDVSRIICINILKLLPKMGKQACVLGCVLLCALVPAYLLYRETIKDGGYSPWADWSTCTKTCDEGLQSRVRFCTNPKPGHFGKFCAHLGISKETRPCLVKHCPVDGIFSPWSVFGNCDKTCGNDGVKKRSRICADPAPAFDGKPCEGLSEEFKPCQLQPCPIDGGLTEWTAFGACDKECGAGNQKRTRTCSNPPPANGGKNCDGPLEETKLCNTNPCPVDGGFSEWEPTGKCDKPCGPGEQNMVRNCTNPAPAYGGKDCVGPTQTTRPCKIQDC